MASFKIITFGCKVNQYESQIIREQLEACGFQQAGQNEVIDLFVINSCTVTAKADRGCRETVRKCLSFSPKIGIVVTGCYVTIPEDKEIVSSIDENIKILDNKDKFNIPDILKKEHICSGLPKKSSLNDSLVISYFYSHTRSFLKVQDGCNNFCSYCKVPYVRGRSRSRTPELIIREARALIDNGYKEIVLTGICLGDFGKELGSNFRLSSLLNELSNIKGDFRIRLSSIEVFDVDERLLDTIGSNGKICNHLHIPMQSGDDFVLQKMNRKYTSSEFIHCIKMARDKIPGIAITTDLITGFPFEDETAFQNSLKVLNEIRPSGTHVFSYSPRRGTSAYSLKDSIPKEVKLERLKKVKRLTTVFSKEFKESLYDKNNERLLIEKVRDPESGNLIGYTDTYVRVQMRGPDELLGKFYYLEGLKDIVVQ